MDALFGERKVNWKSLGDFSQLEKTTQMHLKNVYSCLAIAMFAAAAGSYVHIFTGFIQAGLLTSLAGIGLLIWLGMTPHTPENTPKRMGLLSGFAFMTGLSLGPLMMIVADIDVTIIPTAFLGTVVVFTSFTLAALFAQRRSFLYLGAPLMSGLSFLILLSFANIFFGSTMVFKLELYVGLLIFCGLVLFDTQLIVEKCRNGDKDYIWHCVDLFLDFVNIFRRLMVILASNKQEKRRK